MRILAIGIIVSLAGACGSKPVAHEPERTVYVPSKGLSGPPDAPGKLPMSEVDDHMGDVRAEVKACADATTYEGKVSVRVTIQPTGQAAAVLVEASNDPVIDECIVGAFPKTTFPTSERGQRFVYSFGF